MFIDILVTNGCCAAPCNPGIEMPEQWAGGGELIHTHLQHGHAQKSTKAHHVDT